MLSNEGLDRSKSRGALRLTLLTLAATLSIGLSAASPALADHDGYRSGPGVTVRANFPLPLLFPFPLLLPPLPVVHHTSYWVDRHDHGYHYGDYDRRHHKRRHARHDRWDDHRRHKKYSKRHERRGRHGHHDRHDGRRKHRRRH